MLRTVPKGVHVAEAFMVRHHPQWLKAREIVRAGTLGEVRAVHAFFSYFNVDPENVRNMADIGGGGIYDIGCYPVVVSRYIFGAEPERVVSLVDRDPRFRTDRLASALMDFGKGRQAAFTVSTQIAPYQRVNIVGTKARLEVEIPFNAPQGAAMTVYLDSGKKLGDASARAVRLPKADQYQLEGEQFSRVVRGREKLVYGVEDAILQARVLDALFRSEKSGNWEKP
jgi:predicted dehydrogenase